MHTITLFRANGSWVARFSDPEVATLFGTDTIPTPYRDHAPAEIVLADIQMRNPGCDVRLEEACRASA